MQGTASWIDTFTINMLTTSAANGSRTLHCSPRNIAPQMPIMVPMEEKASLR